MRPVIEICVDDLAGATLAAEAGVERIELCSGLSEGGVTPSIGLIARVLVTLPGLGVQVLIRPRTGDFVFSPDEVAVMLSDIAAIRALPRGASLGFVIGALTAGGQLDIPTLARLVEAAGDVPVTCHKAFDLLDDPFEGLDQLAALGVRRVLTSGGKASALEGVDVLAALVRHAAGRVAILAGGGIRATNVRAVLASGVGEVHLRAMRPRPPSPSPHPLVAGFTGLTTSAEEIALFLKAAA